MSNYTKKLKNPKTGKEQVALCADDFFGSHRYGYFFRKDGKDFDLNDTVDITNYKDFYIFTEEDIMDIKESETTEYIKAFTHISVLDLEEILEYLEDNDFLSEEGKDFRKDLWETYIKE